MATSKKRGSVDTPRLGAWEYEEEKEKETENE